jgi:hypothetical protein
MTSAADSLYATVRGQVAESGKDSRVEVNQRALIDKVRPWQHSCVVEPAQLNSNSNSIQTN